MSNTPSDFPDDPFATARGFTQARIGLGRVGHALPTREVLKFQEAHARARDAIWAPWDVRSATIAFRSLGLPVLVAKSRVTNRAEYLRRPDLGRALDTNERDELIAFRQALGGPIEVVIVVSNGLSSRAVELHGESSVSAISRALGDAGHPVGAIVLVDQGRVAIGDPIGLALGARVVVVVVGERPGLSASDGLGIYITYAPNEQRSDADRNCISNLRPPDGLGYEEAAAKVVWLVREACTRGLSGVQLKDEAPPWLQSPSRPTIR